MTMSPHIKVQGLDPEPSKPQQQVETRSTKEMLKSLKLPTRTSIAKLMGDMASSPNATKAMFGKLGSAVGKMLTGEAFKSFKNFYKIK